MAKQEEQKEVEEKYMILQLIAGQLQEMQKQLESLEAKSGEIVGLKNSLSRLSGTKINSKSYSSLGLGTFVESEIKNTGNVLVNVGAGVLVKKTTTEADELASMQLAQMDDVAQRLTQNIAAMTARAQELESEIQGLLKE
ncbi:MAG TPA: prefoldin subunit alpha [Nanoarchaeota archaeon]|nr:prefoldin subunit alpha [Nanoarchaeota archaeon]